MRLFLKGKEEHPEMERKSTKPAVQLAGNLVPLATVIRVLLKIVSILTQQETSHDFSAELGQLQGVRTRFGSLDESRKASGKPTFAELVTMLGISPDTRNGRLFYAHLCADLAEELQTIFLTSLPLLAASSQQVAAANEGPKVPARSQDELFLRSIIAAVAKRGGEVRIPHSSIDSVARRGVTVIAKSKKEVTLGFAPASTRAQLRIYLILKHLISTEPEETIHFDNRDLDEGAKHVLTLREEGGELVASIQSDIVMIFWG